MSISRYKIISNLAQTLLKNTSTFAENKLHKCIVITYFYQILYFLGQPVENNEVHDDSWQQEIQHVRESRSVLSLSPIHAALTGSSLHRIRRVSKDEQVEDLLACHVHVGVKL